MTACDDADDDDDDDDATCGSRGGSFGDCSPSKHVACRRMPDLAGFLAAAQALPETSSIARTAKDRPFRFKKKREQEP